MPVLVPKVSRATNIGVNFRLSLTADEAEILETLKTGDNNSERMGTLAVDLISNWFKAQSLKPKTK